MSEELKKIIGQTIRIKMDRPLGSAHPKFPELIYPINYGYVPYVMGGDGMEQDVYLLGVSQPVAEFSAQVIAVIQRFDDVEVKWVAAPAGQQFSRADIQEATFFQEKYFDSQILM